MTPSPIHAEAAGLRLSDETKACSRCGIVQSVQNFHVNHRDHSKYRSVCRICTSAYHREYRKSHAMIKPRERNRRDALAYKQRNPEKIKARAAVKVAVRDGHMEKQNCRDCDSPISEFHHTNGYDKENHLVGIWVCREHHMQEHREVRRKTLILNRSPKQTKGR